MLDIRRIKANLEDIKKAMNRRGEKEFNLDEVEKAINKHIKYYNCKGKYINVDSIELIYDIKFKKDVSGIDKNTLITELEKLINTFIKLFKCNNYHLEDYNKFLKKSLFYFT